MPLPYFSLGARVFSSAACASPGPSFYFRSGYPCEGVVVTETGRPIHYIRK